MLELRPDTQDTKEGKEHLLVVIFDDWDVNILYICCLGLLNYKNDHQLITWLYYPRLSTDCFKSSFIKLMDLSWWFRFVNSLLWIPWFSIFNKIFHYITNFSRVCYLRCCKLLPIIPPPPHLYTVPFIRRSWSSWIFS